MRYTLINLNLEGSQYGIYSILMETEESTDDLSDKIDDLVEEYEESVSEEDRDVVDKADYIYDKLAEQGYKMLYFNQLDKNLD